MEAVIESVATPEPLGVAIEPNGSGEAVSGLITYEEFLRLYDGRSAEWVAGRVELRMSRSDEHQDLQRFLLALLAFWVESGDFGIVRGAPFQMRISSHPAGREPDVLFVAREHLDRLRPTFLDGPADIAIEIISPESGERDRGEKFFEYEAGGVREYWLLDPQRRRAEWYQLQDDGAYRAIAPGPDGMYRSQVLAGLWMREEWLWQRPLPKLLDVLREWQLI